MPWETFKLNDGHQIPAIAFGTWKLGNGASTISQVDQALSVGFSHVDTAQLYRNESEAGTAIRESGLVRDNIFITTKYSGSDGLDVQTSILNSLKYLGVSYVDLYLIHGPRLARPDIPTFWKEMEEIKAQGLAKSIGVSNFNASELAILLASATVKPVVNQILLHPYMYAEQLPILEFAAKHKIVIEAYSALIPITSLPSGPLDAPLAQIAGRLGVSTDQVLLAWTKAKGAVVVTTSSKKSRLEGYLNAGDLVLTEEEIAAIDAAGAQGAPRTLPRGKFVRRVLAGGAVSVVMTALTRYLGVSILNGAQIK
ncbi:NADP-dependent oxidoreductase domain-containing protein [Mycena maculata]|uniref:NADP-dependent oxidoreductase domain-containing protein n=1 Tax=Mycena maculata TaxID=230809 RepID=A0AAD7JRG8_9AGAR|nr:NADP-dependent oxidoreductase domain-containing protein [Mycena maculata]